MPARIVIVHDDCDFLQETTTALRNAGHEVAAYANTLAALTALEQANKVELLITRIEYAEGQPHGLALARIARLRRPQVKVIFITKLEHRSVAEGLGDFIATPTTPEVVLEIVGRILTPP